MKLLSVFLLAFACIAISGNSCLAQFQFFAWSRTGGNSYSSSLNGIAGTLSYTTAANDSGGPIRLSANDPTFVSSYGANLAGFEMSSGVGGSSANSTAAILFDAPLPAGAVLIATDVDTSRNDQIQFSNTGLQVALIEQLESIAGASSVFPAWDGSLQLLASTSSTGNSSEATVFNVSGLNSIDLTYTRDNGGSAVGGVNFVIGVPTVLVLGDVNLDGVVDFSDIPAFIAVLAGGGGGRFQAEADTNQSGSIDFGDIQPFIDILAGQ